MKALLLLASLALIALGIALACLALFTLFEVPTSAPLAADAFDVAVATVDIALIPPPDDDTEMDSDLPAPTLAPTEVHRSPTPPRAGATTAAPAATRAPTPMPSKPTPTAAPPPPNLPALPGTLNVILLGSDHRPGSDDWRTDTMIVVMLDPKAKQVGVINLPRDLWVNIPGRAPNRINTLDEFGGPPLVKQVIGSLLGIKIDYYVRIDFEGMVKAIDAVGPIMVDVDCSLEEKYPDASKPGGVRVLKVSPGRTRMDGQMALDYSRSRLSTGVTDRMRRQNRVLLGVRERLLSPDLFGRIPQLWITTQKYVQTDLPATLILPLARQAADIKMSEVHGMIIEQNLASQVTSPQGWWIMVPNVPQIRAAVRGIFGSAPLSSIITRPGGCK